MKSNTQRETPIIAKGLCRLLSASFIAASLVGTAADAFAEGQQQSPVSVLSSRPDMVSEGSALIGVQVPSGAKISDIKIAVDGKDVTDRFKASGGSLIGLVSGLRVGNNQLAVSGAGKNSTLTLQNHDRNGPIISGPHQTPFICETSTFKLPDGSTLGAPQDSDCNVSTKVMFLYMPKGEKAFKPLPSTTALPADTSTTTTMDGKTVNFIVRLEVGTLNRSIYYYAVPFDPTKDPAPQPLANYSGWNHKIIYAFGGSAAAGYHQSSPFGNFASEALNPAMLSRGFAVLSSTFNVNGTRANDVIEAETASMVKEKFIKTFGAPIYTIGWGGSGGSIQQHVIANNYPGILDGINPSLSFSDLMSVVPPIVDCTLLMRAFNSASQKWTDAQKKAASGYNVWSTCEGPGLAWSVIHTPGWMMTTQHLLPPFGPIDISNCSHVVPHELTFDPKKNRKGARCDIFSAMTNQIGIDPATGFAARGYDNVGVQYGLQAFQNGQVTADQFVELNEKIGGFDEDGNLQAARTAASPIALNNLYEFGRINEAKNLANVPIIDFRPDPGVDTQVHDSVESLIMRARLIRSNGTADNQVIIRRHEAVPPAGPGAQAVGTDSYVLQKMDQWLMSIKNDRRSYASVAQKVIANKPADLKDACVAANGEVINEAPDIKNRGECGRIMLFHGNPRMAAGGPLTDDVLKCQLKPLQISDYPKMSTDLFKRLNAVFPQGVCDYSKPSAGAKPLKGPWLAYSSPGVAAPLK